jgi:hypothetical protein
MTYKVILPQEELDAAGKLVGAATEPGNWWPWPVSMIIVAAIGAALAIRVWNAKPKSASSSGH